MTGLAAIAAGAEDLIRLAGVALLHGTALAAVAWLLGSTLLRRARASVIAGVWMVVLLKFVIPVGPAMPWSLSDLLAALTDRADAGVPLMAAPLTAPAVPLPSPEPGVLALIALAAVVLWAAGVAAIAVRRIRGHRAAVASARSLPPAGAELVALARRIADRLGLARMPELRVAPGAGSPWVAGVLAPVVVVPAGWRRADDLAAALAHELAHLRRRDAWLRLVQVAVGALFFFWPVVRLVNRRIDSAREMACDAWAVAHGPLPARDYARLLVRLVRVRTPDGAFALAAAPGLLRGRVDALLAVRASGRPGVGKLGALGLAAWTALALGGASRASAAPAGRQSCVFTPELASSILAFHPEADADRNGVLSRAEACDFQLELRRRLVVVGGTEPAAEVALAASPLVTDPLCCNCGEGDGTSSPTVTPSGAIEPTNTCVRGVDP